MNKRIRVGAVSYLNTKPLLFGLKQSGLIDKIELIEDYPSKIATLLLNNQIDIGLVPVVTIPLLAEAHIISNFCIGANGDVASVALFSEVPIEKITKLILDFQSRTSVILARILMKEFWKLELELVNATEDFGYSIKGSTAGVIIGDRALEQLGKSLYVYDLAGIWKTFTGLPFVFAAWVSNKPIEEDFSFAFNHANEYGINHLDEVIASISYKNYDLKKYFTQNISYQFDDLKREGMALFLQKAKKLM